MSLSKCLFHASLNSEVRDYFILVYHLPSSGHVHTRLSVIYLNIYLFAD